MSGGYHHASRQAAEGFCIYNDIGITYDGLVRAGGLQASDRILIVDVDAHHGNGNARVFAEAPNVALGDGYNQDIYPTSPVTRQRVDLPVPLPSGTTGADYLARLEGVLRRIEGRYRLAFVVAGTDVLATDPLGRLELTIDDCAARDRMVVERLRELSAATVVVAGGGYSAESSKAMIASIKSLAGR